MASTERRQRERAERHRLILTTARTMAEEQGWTAVTTRRLADAVEYSQPVLYSHFAGKDAIIAAVALDGFAELRTALTAAPDTAGLARAYLAFAREHPAVYDAMFAEASTLAFAADETPKTLREAFQPLIQAAGNETTAEVLWAALHGLATLERANRLRPTEAEARLTVLVAALTRHP